MRTRILIMGLLAAAATPAIAQNAGNGGRGWHHERSGGGGGGGGGGGTPQRDWQPRAQAAPQVQAQQQQQIQRWNGGGGWRQRSAAPPSGQQPQAQSGWSGGRQQQGQAGPARQGYRGDWRGGRGGVAVGEPNPNAQRWNRDRGNDGIRDRRDWDRGNDGRIDRRWDRNRDGVRDRGGWSRNWRNDNRYDWQRYRYSNRNLFRAPRYYAPYGYDYGYRRFGIGVYLDSLFYSDRYWIDDPYQYRLPPAYPPYRWIRYYNDALLIDEDTGYVVDAIYDFFW